MPSAEREARALESEIEQLQGTAETLLGHKEHFDSLIAAQEQGSHEGGFFASLTGALQGFVEVVENGLFGTDEDSTTFPAGGPIAKSGTGATGSRKGINNIISNLQSGITRDTTDADRADTLVHLRQVSTEIQERLDHLTRHIADRQDRLTRVVFHSGDPAVDTDVVGPPVVRREPVDPAPEPPPPVRHVDPAVVTNIGLPDVPTPFVVTPSTIVSDEPAVVVDHVIAPPVIAPDVDLRVVTNIDLPDVNPPVVLTPSRVVSDEPAVVVDHVIAPPIVATHLDLTTPSFEPNVAVQIGELAGEIYDVNALVQSGKTVADLRARDIPAGVLTASGLSVHDLLGGGYTIADLREAGVNAMALHSEGVAVASLHDAGYGFDDLRSFASVADLRGLASASEMRAAGYSAADLHNTYPTSELSTLFSAHELKDAGVEAGDLRGLKSLSDLRSAYDLRDLSAAFSAYDLRAEGVSASDLLHSGFSLASLHEAGFSYHDLVSAGAGVHELLHLYPHEATDDGAGERAASDGFFR